MKRKDFLKTCLFAAVAPNIIPKNLLASSVTIDGYVLSMADDTPFENAEVHIGDTGVNTGSTTATSAQS